MTTWFMIDTGDKSYKFYYYFGISLPLSWLILGIIVIAVITLGLVYCVYKHSDYYLSYVIIEALNSVWVKLKQETSEQFEAKKYGTDLIKHIIALLLAIMSKSDKFYDILPTLLENMKDIQKKYSMLSEPGHRNNWTSVQDTDIKLINLELGEILYYIRDRENKSPNYKPNYNFNYLDVENSISKVQVSLKNAVNTTSDNYQFSLPHRNLQKICLLYPIVVVFAIILAASVIFLSEILLMESTGMCDTHKDCFAIDLNLGKHSEKLQYDDCNDYLASNRTLIICYSLSFNYLSAISKAGSVLSFGLFFLSFIISVLGTAIFIGKKGTKELHAATVFFVIVNSLINIFFIVCQVSIFGTYNHGNPGKTDKQLLEIYVGYVIIINLAIHITTIITCTIFYYFKKKYWKVLKLIEDTEHIVLPENNFIDYFNLDVEQFYFIISLTESNHVWNSIMDEIKSNPKKIIHEETHWNFKEKWQEYERKKEHNLEKQKQRNLSLGLRQQQRISSHTRHV